MGSRTDARRKHDCLRVLYFSDPQISSILPPGLLPSNTYSSWGNTVKSIILATFQLRCSLDFVYCSHWNNGILFLFENFALLPPKYYQISLALHDATTNAESIFLFFKYLWSTSYVPGTVLDTREGN